MIKEVFMESIAPVAFASMVYKKENSIVTTEIEAAFFAEKCWTFGKYIAKASPTIK